MRITFSIPYVTEWGQKLYVSGEGDILGNWDTATALEMHLNRSGYWVVEVDVPMNLDKPLPYKYFLKDERNQGIIWESGPNRIVKPFSPNIEEAYCKDLWRPETPKDQVWYSKLFTEVLMKRSKGSSTAPLFGMHTPYQLRFQLYAPRVASNHVICVIGDHPSLGEWNPAHAFILEGGQYPLWTGELNLHEAGSISYKYALLDTTHGTIVQWEQGENRTVTISSSSHNKAIVLTDNEFRHAPNSWKAAGIAVPVFSLRTKEDTGVGEFLDLIPYIDWAQSIGIKLIQLLPINDTIATHTWVDSYPYAAISVFALHPIYLNLRAMSEHYGLTYADSYKETATILNNRSTIDYEGVMKVKSQFYKELYDEVKDIFLKEPSFLAFWEEHHSWLRPYAAFSYLRDQYGTASFKDWPAHSVYQSDEIDTLTDPSQSQYDDLAIHYFIQYHLHLQLSQAVAYAHEHQIALKGDIPIGIYRNSVDAWVQPEIYHMGVQAGAPPDDFAVRGQNWGFPTYYWEKMAQNNFSWWKKRLIHMSHYFDAYRIDHILGFFRIWEIPMNAVEGLLGHFNPSLPYHLDELSGNGLYLDYDRLCKPFIREHMLEPLFGPYTVVVKETFLHSPNYEQYELHEGFRTQREVEVYLQQREDWEVEMRDRIRQGLFSLISEVIFIEAPFSHREAFNPRIALQHTRSFQHLDQYTQSILNRLYDDYFYQRHEEFWRNEAMAKLPSITQATDMMVCGEDLGMVPDVVPSVMDELGILSLEIQRMPKDPQKQFGHPSDYPYLSVCSTSTHDMPTMRAWWEMDRARTQAFYRDILGHHDVAPYFCEPWVSQEIITQHLYSPSMWAIFPIQDILALDGQLRRENPHEEQINVPSNPQHYWRYRLHIDIDTLKQSENLNQLLIDLLKASDRNTDF